MDQIQKDLLNHYGIKKYGTSSDRFMALGDELGLTLRLVQLHGSSRVYYL